jgi:hypothetical protein
MDSDGQSRTPARLNVSRAAKAAGVARSTLNKHIEDGKVSVTRDATGKPFVDIAELERVYGRVDMAALSESVAGGQSETPENRRPDTALQQEVALLRERLAMIEMMHETERRLLSERIEELAARAAELRQERDAWRGQAERLLLTDQRQGSNRAEPSPEAPGKPAEGLRARLARWVAGAG